MGTCPTAWHLMLGFAATLTIAASMCRNGKMFVCFCQCLGDAALLAFVPHVQPSTTHPFGPQRLPLKH